MARRERGDVIEERQLGITISRVTSVAHIPVSCHTDLNIGPSVLFPVLSPNPNFTAAWPTFTLLRSNPTPPTPHNGYILYFISSIPVTQSYYTSPPFSAKGSVLTPPPPPLYQTVNFLCLKEHEAGTDVCKMEGETKGVGVGE